MAETKSIGSRHFKPTNQSALIQEIRWKNKHWEWHPSSINLARWQCELILPTWRTLTNYKSSLICGDQNLLLRLLQNHPAEQTKQAGVERSIARNQVEDSARSPALSNKQTPGLPATRALSGASDGLAAHPNHPSFHVQVLLFQAVGVLNLRLSTADQGNLDGFRLVDCLDKRKRPSPSSCRKTEGLQ